MMQRPVGKRPMAVERMAPSLPGQTVSGADLQLIDCFGYDPPQRISMSLAPDGVRVHIQFRDEVIPGNETLIYFAPFTAPYDCKFQNVNLTKENAVEDPICGWTNAVVKIVDYITESLG